jgi:hypothetical protein
VAEERQSGSPAADAAPTEPAAESAAEPTSVDVQAKIATLSDEERAVLAKVAEIVRKIRYGTVVLVIQDGKVVQIEMAEKFRLR